MSARRKSKDASRFEMRKERAHLSVRSSPSKRSSSDVEEDSSTDGSESGG